MPPAPARPRGDSIFRPRCVVVVGDGTSGQLQLHAPHGPTLQRGGRRVGPAAADDERVVSAEMAGVGDDAPCSRYTTTHHALTHDCITVVHAPLLYYLASAENVELTDAQGRADG